MNIREINEAIEEAESLKLIAQAYGEIASLKIRKIRAQVEKNRHFFDEIAAIYRIVKEQANLKQVAVKKNKKTISVLLTSNYRFYGGIDTDVIHFFLQATPKIQTDRLVIGLTGIHYLKVINYFNTYQTIQLRGDLPNIQELNILGTLIKDYAQVLVFYPKLSTLLVQKPNISDITQSGILTSTTYNLQPTTSNYVIFEPELEKILKFFDNQIITLLLEQTFFEAELSRTASRILSMDQAQLEANKYLSSQRQLKAHVIRVIEDARLLENLTTIEAIRKEKTNY